MHPHNLKAQISCLELWERNNFSSLTLLISWKYKTVQKSKKCAFFFLSLDVESLFHWLIAIDHQILSPILQAGTSYHPFHNQFHSGPVYENYWKEFGLEIKILFLPWGENSWNQQDTNKLQINKPALKYSRWEESGPNYTPYIKI